MTTYSFTGIIWEGPDALNATSAVESTFELVVPETTTGFTYSLTGLISGVGLPIVDIDIVAYSLFAGTDDLARNEFTEIELAEISWNDGTSKTAWILNIHDPVASLDYIMAIGGDALPSFADLPAFLAFTNSVTIGPANAGTGFEPGDVIPLSGIPAATVSEDDLIYDAEGGETLYGGLGDDTIYASTAGTIDYAFGGDGNDTFNAENAGMIMNGGAGDDTFYGGGTPSAEVSYLGASGGVNVYLAYTGRDVGSGQGADTLVDIGTVTGTDHNDRLIADKTGTGLVRLFGEAGDDVIKGGEGNEQFYGGDGADRIRANGGNDTLRGGDGDDVLQGLGGDDELRGDAGIDYIYGNADNDVLYGGADGDFLRGNRGADTMYGDEGVDNLRGGGGADELYGGADDDFLLGDNGQDTLEGGAGDDSLTGGSGGGIGDASRDTFVFVDTAGGSGGYDRVKDFEDGIDVIDLTYFGFTDFATEIEVLASDIAAGMRINFGGGDVLLIEGFSKADFDVSDVLF